MEPIRILIELADGVVNVTADRLVEVLVLRYDDLLADAVPERCPVAVNRRRVNRLFRDAAAGDEGAAPPE